MNIKRFCEGAPEPVRKTEGAVGYDLVACVYSDMAGRAWRTDDLCSQILPDDRGCILLPSGWGFEIPLGHVGMVVPRSSTAHWVLPGYVDPDYRGEVFVKTTLRLMRLHKPGLEQFDRIAQLIIVPVVTPEITVVDELSQTARGAGGHGSTGR
jgi:dUTP pyrophosphatase